MTLIEGVMGQVADLSASVQVASAGTAETAHSSNHYSIPPYNIVVACFRHSFLARPFYHGA